MAKKNKKKIQQDGKKKGKTVKKSKAKIAPKKAKKESNAPKLKRTDGLWRWQQVRKEVKAQMLEKGEEFKESEVKSNASSVYSGIKDTYTEKTEENLSVVVGSYFDLIDIDLDEYVEGDNLRDWNGGQWIDEPNMILKHFFWWKIAEEVLASASSRVVVDNSSLSSDYYDGSASGFSLIASEYDRRINDELGRAEGNYYYYVVFDGIKDNVTFTYYKLVHKESSFIDYTNEEFFNWLISSEESEDKDFDVEKYLKEEDDFKKSLKQMILDRHEKMKKYLKKQGKSESAIEKIMNKIIGKNK